jgi:hypothetical protein
MLAPYSALYAHLRIRTPARPIALQTARSTDSVPDKFAPYSTAQKRFLVNSGRWVLLQAVYVLRLAAGPLPRPWPWAGNARAAVVDEVPGACKMCRNLQNVPEHARAVTPCSHDILRPLHLYPLLYICSGGCACSECHCRTILVYSRHAADTGAACSASVIVMNVCLRNCPVTPFISKR